MWGASQANFPHQLWLELRGVDTPYCLQSAVAIIELLFDFQFLSSIT